MRAIIKPLLATIVSGTLIAATAPGAIANDDWQTSKWGDDDTIGAANYLSADRILEATRLVTEGKAYSLGVELNRDFPAYGTRFLTSP